MYTLVQEQHIRASQRDAWNFLKNPENLNRITPSDLHFSIVSDVPEEMFDGLVIEYRIQIPWFGRRQWVAEIKHVKEMYSFVDEQRIGPYSFWYHYHRIEQENSHVRLTDRVYYEVPYGIIGKILHFFFIRKTLERIFHYRRIKLQALLTGGD